MSIKLNKGKITLMLVSLFIGILTIVGWTDLDASLSAPILAQDSPTPEVLLETDMPDVVQTKVQKGEVVTLEVCIRATGDCTVTWNLNGVGEYGKLDTIGEGGLSNFYHAPDTPGGKAIVEVIVTDEQGRSVTATRTFVIVDEAIPIETPIPSTSTVVNAIRIDQPPMIDREYIDFGAEVWSLAEPLEYAVHPVVNDSTTAVVRLLWDEHYLYAHFDVSDTQVEEASWEAHWDSDSVSVVIINGGKIQEYRHSMLDDYWTSIITDRRLKCATTFNNTNDQDKGYVIGMRIPWDTPPVEGSTIAADFLSVDHDYNPGSRYRDPGTVFSRISWDGDGNIDTARKSILLKPALTPPPPTGAPPPPHKTVAFKTFHDRFVTAMGADRDWVLRAETRQISDWEKFTLICLDNGKVALTTSHGRYVTAMNDQPGFDWELRGETNVLSDWEKFTVIDPDTEEQLTCMRVFELLEQGEVRIALQTYHNRYVTAMNDEPGRDWKLRGETNELRDWEKFTVIPQ